MGLAAASVAVCVVNVFITFAMHKRYDVEARRILTGLDAGPIRVLELTLSPDLEPDVAETLRSFWRSRTTFFETDKQEVRVPVSLLDAVRIDGETIYIEIDTDSGNNPGSVLIPLRSSTLAKVVIREAGHADEVIEIAPKPESEQTTEPASEPEAASPI